MHLYGAFWESFVVGQVLRTVAETGLTTPVYHWRTTSGQEVDAVLEIGDSLLASECKSGERPQPQDARGLRAFQDAHGPARVKNLWIVCNTPATYLLENGIEVMGAENLAHRLRAVLGR